jgi:site-specific recombinase XerD
VHALRHTFAMDLLTHGADIVELQTLLGHSSLNTTRRYLTAQPDQLRAAIATSAASAAIDSLTAAGATDRGDPPTTKDG